MMRPGLLRDLAVGVLLLALLIALPLVFTKPALRDFLIYVMAYGLLAMSLNLLIGLTGLVSFGHAAYFASGAYMFGLLMQSGVVEHHDSTVSVSAPANSTDCSPQVQTSSATQFELVNPNKL